MCAFTKVEGRCLDLRGWGLHKEALIKDKVKSEKEEGGFTSLVNNRKIQLNQE